MPGFLRGDSRRQCDCKNRERKGNRSHEALRTREGGDGETGSYSGDVGHNATKGSGVGLNVFPKTNTDMFKGRSEGRLHGVIRLLHVGELAPICEVQITQI